MAFTNKFKVGDTVKFRRYSWSELQIGKIISTEHYKGILDQQVDVYIIKDQNGIERPVFEKDIENVQ